MSQPAVYVEPHHPVDKHDVAQGLDARASDGRSLIQPDIRHAVDRRTPAADFAVELSAPEQDVAIPMDCDASVDRSLCTSDR
jgi:hypothetical protein